MNEVSRRRTPGRAVAALVLGVLGVTVVPLIASVVAVIVGRGARAEIDADPESLEGRNLAVAGIILGWIGIALFGLGVLFGLLVGLP